MYQWYARAAVCYAYLEDVHRPAVLFDGLSKAFKGSKWFTRGWTLQELLAPARVAFFTGDWYFFGTRDSLRRPIEEITGISSKILCSGPYGFFTASVATRLSWAANRETTREEDLAYCLLGLFDVNMPLLYGEGSKAFLRLQQAIIRQSDDLSIFLWKSADRRSAPFHGLLADHPNDFSSCGYTLRPTLQDRARMQPLSMTNKGLLIHMPLIALSSDVYLALVYSRGDEVITFDAANEAWTAIYLKRLLSDANLFSRTFTGETVRVITKSELEPTAVLIRQDSLQPFESPSSMVWPYYHDCITHVRFDISWTDYGIYAIWTKEFMKWKLVAETSDLFHLPRSKLQRSPWLSLTKAKFFSLRNNAPDEVEGKAEIEDQAAITIFIEHIPTEDRFVFLLSRPESSCIGLNGQFLMGPETSISHDRVQHRLCIKRTDLTFIERIPRDGQRTDSMPADATKRQNAENFEQHLTLRIEIEPLSSRVPLFQGQPPSTTDLETKSILSSLLASNTEDYPSLLWLKHFGPGAERAAEIQI